MSKIKIYDGVVIDMATSNIIKEGKVSYANSDQVAYTKGGDKTQVTNTGVASEFKPQISSMLGTAESLYGSGKLGAVAGFTPEQMAAQQQSQVLAQNQLGLESGIAGLAQQPLNLQGMRTAAATQAQQALGLNAYGAGRAGGDVYRVAGVHRRGPRGLGSRPGAGRRLRGGRRPGGPDHRGRRRAGGAARPDRRRAGHGRPTPGLVLTGGRPGRLRGYAARHNRVLGVG